MMRPSIILSLLVVATVYCTDTPKYKPNPDRELADELRPKNLLPHIPQQPYRDSQFQIQIETRDRKVRKSDRVKRQAYPQAPQQWGPPPQHLQQLQQQLQQAQPQPQYQAQAPPPQQFRPPQPPPVFQQQYQAPSQQQFINQAVQGRFPQQFQQPQQQFALPQVQQLPPPPPQALPQLPQYRPPANSYFEGPKPVQQLLQQFRIQPAPAVYQRPPPPPQYQAPPPPAPPQYPQVPPAPQLPEQPPLDANGSYVDVSRYYYPERERLPLPKCFHNPTGYVCCNAALNDLIVETYSELEARPKFHTCNVQALATHLQSAAQEKFNTPFETIASFEDFAQKIHFKDDLVCKVELGGRYMLAYGTYTDVEEAKLPVIEEGPSRGPVDHEKIRKLRQALIGTRLSN